MQGTNQLVRSNRGLGVLLRDTSTRPGWDRTGNPPPARRLLLPPELYRSQITNCLITILSRKAGWCLTWQPIAVGVLSVCVCV